MAIERFYSAGSSEALAEAHVREYIFHDPDMSVQTMASCAAYAAVVRFVTRGDEYPILPRNARELQSVLYNHSVDVIHSLISQTVSRIPVGGYQKARELAAASIASMLRTGDNAQVLLALHHTVPAYRPRTFDPGHSTTSAPRSERV